MAAEQLERNKQAVRDYIAAFDAKSLEILEDLATPEFFQETKERIKAVDGMFSDHCIRIDELIAEGNQIVAKVFSDGRHTGDFMGVPGTGREWQNNEGVLIFAAENGTLKEMWAIFNIPMHFEKLGITMSFKA